jgi:GR25 family glycosyltransferase involved in LPS biosynthesis
MSNKVSAAIINHISRKHMADRLVATLGPNTKVFTSVADLAHNDCVENSRKAWASFDKNKEYFCVLEDDAILCRNFYERLDKILTDQNRIYNLYWSNMPLPEGALKQGFVLANHHVSIPAAAICIPTKLIPDMLKFTEPLTGWMDCRIVKWAHDNDIMIYYPIPCLVDHNSAEKSLLMGYVEPNRRSSYFIDAQNG